MKRGGSEYVGAWTIGRFLGECAFCAHMLFTRSLRLHVELELEGRNEQVQGEVLHGSRECAYYRTEVVHHVRCYEVDFLTCTQSPCMLQPYLQW